MRNIILLLSVFMLSSLAFSQELKGTILDETGIPLAGANIVCTVSKNFTTTDFDGNFTIKVSKDDKIMITYIGYKSMELKPVFPTMSITMQPEATSLDEVVVVGYGTRKAIDATMSVAKVKADELSKQKVLNPTQAIQGKLPGVTIISSDQPGAAQFISIRGVNSVSSSLTPLYVVDGIRQDNINNLNPSDIESYEVLKDASALAIYGTQASNGVILITTKKGKGDLKVSTESYFGYRTPLKMVEMAGSNLYAQYTNLANQTVTISQDQPVNTNWFKEVMQPGMYNSNDFNVSGSTDKMNITFSANNYYETPIIKGYKYNRTTFRLFDEFKPNEKVKFTTSLNVGFTKINPKSVYALTTAYRQAPIVPVYYADGKYGMPFVGSNGFVEQAGNRVNNLGNPVKDLDFQLEQSKNLNLLGSFSTEVKFFEFLKFTGSFGGEVNNWRGYYFDKREESYLAENPSETIYTGEHVNALTKNRSNSFKYNISNFLTFNKVIKENHDLELMGGMDLISYNGGEYLGGTRYDIDPTEENYWSFNFSNNAENQSTWGGQSTEVHQMSFYGRIQYKLMDKYLLTGNFRRDGTSQFLPDRRWGNFPSFGLGWIISKENFMQDVVFLNMLKLRGGWGIIGNANIPSNIFSFAFNTTGYPFGGAPQPYVTDGSAIDPDLSWEETSETSLGVDFEMFDHKFKGSIDVYDKLNQNAIMYLRGVSSTGEESSVPKHAGEISNKGIEVSMDWTNKINENMNYNFGIAYSYNKNELKKLFKNINEQTFGGLGNGQSVRVVNQDAVGHPVGSYYLYDYAGIDDSGNMLYYTSDGDMVLQDALTSSDKKFMGTAMPSNVLGFNFGFTYKKVSISLQGYGTQGAKIYNGKKAQRWGGENIELSIAQDFWSPFNTDSNNPAPFNYVPVASSYYLESGDFIRINNINLSYNISEVKNLIKGGQLYLNVINPFIYQKYSGFSPEISGDYYNNVGIELGAYPTLRSFVMGLKLNF